MTTNQEGKHISFRAISSTSGTYNEDATAAMIVESATGSTFNELMLSWLQIRTSSAETNLADLQNLFATQEGFNNWQDMNAFNAVE